MANGEFGPIVTAAQEEGPGPANTHRNTRLVTESFDTIDLQQAKALLDELSTEDTESLSER